MADPNGRSRERPTRISRWRQFGARARMPREWTTSAVDPGVGGEASTEKGRSVSSKARGSRVRPTQISLWRLSGARAATPKQDILQLIACSKINNVGGLSQTRLVNQSKQYNAVQKRKKIPLPQHYRCMQLVTLASYGGMAGVCGIKGLHATVADSWQQRCVLQILFLPTRAMLHPGQGELPKTHNIPNSKRAFEQPERSPKCHRVHGETDCR